MKILVLGDTHADFGFVRSSMTLAEASGCDAIYVVGDFGYFPHTDWGNDFLDDVEVEAERLGIPVFFCDGNHENFDWLYDISVSDDGFRYVRSNIIHTPRGHIWEWGGKMFMAMGGAHSIDGPGGIWGKMRGPGNMWWPQETITEEEVHGAIQNIDMLEAQERSIDVLFAHDVPIEVNIPGINGYPLGDMNRTQLSRVAWMADPSLIVSGHYHRYYRGLVQLPYNQAEQIILDCNGASGSMMILDTRDLSCNVLYDPRKNRPSKFDAPRLMP